MSLLHPGLLYGLILAAIPVVLHFLMRSRPRKFDFPALRLLENIRKQNVQRLRLRHLGLLLLRILLLVVIVLAVARPTLPAANYALSGGEWARLLIVAAAVGAIYYTGLKFWVPQKNGASARLLRTSWLRAGTTLGAIALLLLFVAWPYQRRVQGEIRSPGDQRQLNLPVAAVLLFDLSISMEYQYENQSRTQQAFQLAQQQVSGFPASSRVALGDNASSGSLTFLNDPATALIRLQRTESRQPRAATLPLNERVLAAITLQQSHRDQILSESGGGETDRFLREVYIYTDRARSAWSLQQSSRLQAEMERVPWLRVYVIDVGVSPVVNFSLSHLELARERLVQGGLARVACEVNNQSPQAAEMNVELFLEDHGGTPLKRDQQVLSIPAGESRQVSFTFPVELPGVLQGEFRLTSTDPLSSDNALPFTLQVERRPLVWLVAETAEEAFVWQQALAPAELIERGVHQYEVIVIRPQRLNALLEQAGGTDARVPDAIYILNLARLSPAAWSALREYVSAGGGLGTILGHSRVEALNYREQGQADWLPGLPTVHTRANPLVGLDVVRPDHPAFDYLKRLDALTLFSSAGVRRFWKVEPGPEGDVLARFTDPEQSPALVAGRFGRGRVLVLSTAVDLQGAATQNNWSDLARLGWIYTAWADQMTKYLRGAESLRLNRPAGETMLLQIPAANGVRDALLQLPDLRQGKVSLPYRGPYLGLTTETGDSAGRTPASTSGENLGAGDTGHYRLLFPGTPRPSQGFSIHLPDEETSLVQLSDADLDTLFGTDRWQLARSYDELERTVLLGRIGQEAYPLLVSLLLLFFVGEHLVANLFYGRVEKPN